MIEMNGSKLIGVCDWMISLRTSEFIVEKLLQVAHGKYVEKILQKLRLSHASTVNMYLFTVFNCFFA